MTKSRQTLRLLKRKNKGQGTKARAERDQDPPAENPVEQRVAEGTPHYPRQETMPEGNPARGPQGITKQEVVLEGPLAAPREEDSLQMTVPTNKGDGGLVLAPQNKRRSIPPPAEEHRLGEIRLHRTPPMTRASLAAKLQTRPMPTKSRG